MLNLNYNGIQLPNSKVPRVKGTSEAEKFPA